MIDNQQLVSRVIPTMRPPSPLSLAWRKFGSGKAVEDIVTLFTQRRPEISGFFRNFRQPTQLKIKFPCALARKIARKLI